MSDHNKAKLLIKQAEEMLLSQNEPHVSEWVDIVVGLKETLREYVWMREGLEK